MSRRHTEAPVSIVAFASGRGSNFRAICDAIATGALHARIAALVTNVPDAGAVDIARRYEIPVIAVSNAGKKRVEHEAQILDALEKIRFDWIVLAGYMRLFSEEFIRRFWDEKLSAARMVNIHPSILPAFPGTNGYAQALSHGVKLTGATVHLVGTGLDDGPIAAQTAIEIDDQDTEQTLLSRALIIEHKLYVKTLDRLFFEEWTVDCGPLSDGRPRVRWLGKTQKGSA